MDILDLQPFNVGPMQRIGSSNDGGYVIPMEVPASAVLISFGLGDNWSFEKDCLRIGIVPRCIAFDHTVDLRINLGKIIRRLLTPKFKIKALFFRLLVTLKYLRDFSGVNLTHIKKEITKDQNSDKQTNLIEIIKDLKGCDFLLKVDIEGAEYEIIDQISTASAQIPLVVIEFHETDTKRKQFEKSLKLLKSHYLIVHTHANNFDSLSNDGIPKTVELTFLHKKNCSTSKKVTELPIVGLDQPSSPFRPEIYLKF